ncbi:MAG TPA: four helix bundle protein, partial [Pyrinomonadaceae bacterium]|nr:four helix bundle protein [Pyrinomonadaceae bacterium]
MAERRTSDGKRGEIVGSRQLAVGSKSQRIRWLVRNYSELIVWQKAMDLVEGIYAATKQFPKEEIYGLTSQIRRAAVSIPSNIAEGQGRKSINEFLHHLSIAYGSLREVETQILIAERLLY